MDFSRHKKTIQRHLFSPLESLSQSLPVAYMFFVGCIAVLGYLAIFISPFMVLYGINEIFDVAFNQSGNTGHDWTHSAAWGALTLCFILICYSYASTRFRKPYGIELSADKSPQLHNLLTELKKYYKWIEIDRIIITDKYEFEILSTPKYVLPFWHTHTLVIGLPLMQCLTPDNVKCLLARKLGQFSLCQNPFPNWLFRLRYQWQLHSEAFNANKAFGISPLAIFFKLYSPLYLLVSTYIARIDELRADKNASRVINDEEILFTIEKWIIAKQFVVMGFWPGIRKQISTHPDNPSAPFSKLQQAYAHFESKKDTTSILHQAFSQQVDFKEAMPPLIDRLDNIGHTKIKPPQRTLVSAGEVLLKPNYKKVIAVTNKLWQKNTAVEWTNTALSLRDARNSFNALYLKAKRQKLSYSEIWQYSKLQRKLFGKKVAFPITRLLKRQPPELASHRQ